MCDHAFVRPEQATVSTNLRRLREAKGFTQVTLAVKAGVSPATVARIEAGQKPTYGTMESLARALDAPLEELVRVSAAGAA